MKAFLMGIAYVLLFSFFLIYQVDANLLQAQKEMLKYHADEAAATASLFYDYEEFGTGKKVFDDEESNKRLEAVLKANLNLDSSFVPEQGYWTDPLHYTVYYFDDSGVCRTYQDGALVESRPFDYGDLFIEPLTGYRKLIHEPVATVTLDAGTARFRLEFLRGRYAVRETSAYEYVGG